MDYTDIVMMQQPQVFTGQDLLAFERMRRLQAETRRRNARVARETLGIADYSTLQDKLSWASALSALKHMGAGALAGTVLGGAAGAGVGAVSNNKPLVQGMAGGIGGAALGAVLGLIVAGIRGGRGKLVAMRQPATKESIRGEYENLSRMAPGDIGIYDASRFGRRLFNYLQDNTSSSADVQSYAF